MRFLATCEAWGITYGLAVVGGMDAFFVKNPSTDTWIEWDIISDEIKNTLFLVYNESRQQRLTL